jgi:hypothetical protein
VVAWVLFGVLLAVLAWLLLRSGQDDALSSISRPAPDDAGGRAASGAEPGTSPAAAAPGLSGADHSRE